MFYTECCVFVDKPVLCVPIRRFCFVLGPLRLSVLSWPLPRSGVIMPNAAHMVMPWQWTPGARCWVTVEQLNRVWLWWRSTCRSSETPGGTCLCSSIGEMQCSTAVWTEKKSPRKISRLCVLFCESQSSPHMVVVSDCPRKLFIPVLCL